MSASDQIEATLRSVGGGVRVSELAYQTKLSELEVVDALCELENLGRATPWAWTLGPEAKR